MGPLETNLLDILEFVGVVALAGSGALAAAARRLDVAGVCVAAVAVGLAGGTLRDLILGVPVFWLHWPLLLAACVVAASAVWAMGERAWSGRALLWLDAVGLGAITAVGVARAAAVGATPLAAVAIGVLAAAAGGLIRDGVARQAPLVFGRPLYLSAAIAGAALFVLLRLLQADDAASAMAGAILVVALRSGALRYGWALPGWPDRD